jgi:hypothetical protein
MSSGPTEVVSIGDVEVTDTFPKPAAPTAGNTAVEVSALTEPDVTDKQGEVKPEYIPVTKRASKVEQKRKSSTVRRNARLQNIGNETQAKAPRLNDFEDLSDDSLRLSDLVADIDTRD